MSQTDKVAEILAGGGLVVMRSDTVYGIFASALDESAVEKLHAVRERDTARGFIILIDSVEAAARLVRLSDEMLKRLGTIWRADSSTSVILPANNLKEMWLADTRELNPRICFRVPNDENLRGLLKQTGPLCAPSANLPGEKLAQNITEAREYFGDKVALYVDGGEITKTTPSRIIKFTSDGAVETLRSDGKSHPEDFVISRRRKLYKFARFDEYSTCFHIDEWLTSTARTVLIENGNELVVEIGAGSALFSVELARRHPEKTFVAVDIKGDRLYQGAREAEKLSLKNIYFVRSDIARITEVIPPHSVSEIWLTFPDPYANADQTALSKSDAKHRLTAPRYLAYYREILKPDGVLNFKTDNAPLFDWSLEQFAANGWKTEFVTRDLHNSDVEDDVKITTSYEKRFMAENLPIHYAKLKAQAP
jgi:tRNA (guanine-N7-)-methyltransferase